MERRSRQRCPICQGPAVDDASKVDGVRCRVSTCIQNHAHVTCERCGRQDLSDVRYADGHYEYTCRECLNRWKVADT